MWVLLRWLEAEDKQGISSEDCRPSPPPFASNCNCREMDARAEMHQPSLLVFFKDVGCGTGSVLRQVQSNGRNHSSVSVHFKFKSVLCVQKNDPVRLINQEVESLHETVIFFSARGNQHSAVPSCACKLTVVRTRDTARMCVLDFLVTLPPPFSFPSLSLSLSLPLFTELCDSLFPRHVSPSSSYHIGHVPKCS